MSANATILDLKHRIGHLEGEVARLKPLAEQTDFAVSPLRPVTK